mmetsp:Transcript_64004/g.71653  ORF Transcript_64004/g.71653 Transcript_64004/m.71653 type:complete len:107 (+) Transcript_64004:395-715(+)
MRPNGKDILVLSIGIPSGKSFITIHIKMTWHWYITDFGNVFLSNAIQIIRTTDNDKGKKSHVLLHVATTKDGAVISATPAWIAFQPAANNRSVVWPQSNRQQQQHV